MKMIVADLTEELKVKENIEKVHITFNDETGQYATEIRFCPQMTLIEKTLLMIFIRTSMQHAYEKLMREGKDKKMAEFLKTIKIKEMKK